MNFIIAFILCVILFSANSSENKKEFDFQGTEKVIYVGKSSLSKSDFVKTLKKHKVAYDENDNYFLVYNLDFLKLIGILSHNSSSFKQNGVVDSYHWRCGESITFQQKIAQELRKNNIHHALFKNSKHNAKVPPYCYMFYLNDSDKVSLIEKQINETKPIENSVIDEKNNHHFFQHNNATDNNKFTLIKPYVINQSFYIKDMNYCDPLLLSVFSEGSGQSKLIISEVIRDKTHSLSIGDLLTTIPFREMLSPDSTGAVFCRRQNTDYFNFFNESEIIEPDKISIAEVKNETN